MLQLLDSQSSVFHSRMILRLYAGLAGLPEVCHHMPLRNVAGPLSCPCFFIQMGGETKREQRETETWLFVIYPTIGIISSCPVWSPPRTHLATMQHFISKHTRDSSRTHSVLQPASLGQHYFPHTRRYQRNYTHLTTASSPNLLPHYYGLTDSVLSQMVACNAHARV
jgi:hypothetical protein